MVDVSVFVLVEVFQFQYCMSSLFRHIKILDGKDDISTSHWLKQVHQGEQEEYYCRTLSLYHDPEDHCKSIKFYSEYVQYICMCMYIQCNPLNGHLIKKTTF